MKTVISIGNQNYASIRESHSFYVDKTCFIKEWWENNDTVTLITRPRRFGKTLNMSMMEHFFSASYCGRSDLFEGLFIWKQEKYRELQGTYPVISLSFADIKGSSFEAARDGIVSTLLDLYRKHAYLLQGDILTDLEKKDFFTLGQHIDENKDIKKEITENTICWAIKNLMAYMVRFYGKKVIVLLDEYDTPLQEAYVRGYWNPLTALIRGVFNSTFKTNDYLYRGLLTGITRVSKESIFSDLNNLEVVTTTSDKYTSCFGFTEAEVFAALEERGLSSEVENIKRWYDGFSFGNRTDIYNPWSITKYLDSKEYGTYWADTSSNALVSQLIRQGTPELKMQMEDLLADKCLEIALDEQVIFEQLKHTKGAIWSLLVASGYLKPVNKRYAGEQGEAFYHLKITNHETMLMFKKMIAEWFPEDSTSYGDFKKALLLGDLDYMNQFMNEVSEEMFGSFDVGRMPSNTTHPERFYHGFVLGLIVDMAGRYYIRSNRQSGLGRYDVMMEPRNASDDAIVMEFKVFSKKKDKTMEKAVENALQQIDKMKYDTELISRGIPKERIRHYGFAFDGQKVLIGE